MLCCARMRLYITACRRKNPIAPWPIRSCGDFREKTWMKNLKIDLSRSRPFSRPFRVLVFLSLFASPSWAQTKAAHSSAVATSSQQRTELGLQAARQDPLQLRHFLLGMPKGADLHNHLSGAVYAESWIRAGAEDGLCVNLASLSFVKPQQAAENPPSKAACDDGRVPAAPAFKDQHPYDALVDAFS